VQFDLDQGLWIVELEGCEDQLKQVPERCLQAIDLSIHEAARARSRWQMRLRELEIRADETRQMHHRRTKESCCAAAAAGRAELENLVNEHVDERDKVEQLMLDAFASGDVEVLRESQKRAVALLGKLERAPVSERASLTKLSITARARLEQYDEREIGRERQRRLQKKAETGNEPDWRMTPQQFWRYVEAANVAKVRSGLLAQMTLSMRSSDGTHQTVLHAACGSFFADFECGGDISADRTAVTQALLEARANPNATDRLDRTPLDFAIFNGGDRATGEVANEAMLLLNKFGMMTRADAVAQLRAGTSRTLSPAH